MSSLYDIVGRRDEHGTRIATRRLDQGERERLISFLSGRQHIVRMRDAAELSAQLEIAPTSYSRRLIREALVRGSTTVVFEYEQRGKRQIAADSMRFDVGKRYGKIPFRQACALLDPDSTGYLFEEVPQQFSIRSAPTIAELAED